MRFRIVTDTIELDYISTEVLVTYVENVRVFVIIIKKESDFIKTFCFCTKVEVTVKVYVRKGGYWQLSLCP